jgi:hypothetical protein
MQQPWFGLHLLSYTHPDAPPAQMFDRVVEQAKAAEENGFRLVTLMDHVYQILAGYCEAIGRDPATIERTMAAPVSVAGSEAETASRPGPSLARSSGRFVHGLIVGTAACKSMTIRSWATTMALLERMEAPEPEA